MENFQLLKATLTQRKEIKKIAENVGIIMHSDITEANLKYHPDLLFVGNSYILGLKEPVCIDSGRKQKYESVSFEVFIERVKKYIPE